MFLLSHFAFPFYSHRLAAGYRHDDGSGQDGLLCSVLIGLAGVLPDLLDIHLTLTARLQSLPHTVWALVSVKAMVNCQTPVAGKQCSPAACLNFFFNINIFNSFFFDFSR